MLEEELLTLIETIQRRGCEVYSYAAYRKRYREDAREAAGATLEFLVREEVNSYMAHMRSERPNLAATGEAQQLELCGITNKGRITLSALLLFGVYPQTLYPRLCIAAARIPGEIKGTTDEQVNRFSDSESIIGTLPDMLERAMDFVRRNMRIAIGINPNTGQRQETPEYPPVAVREAILNALMHRDYSRYNEDKPILLEMYDDRLEVINPGGLYGRTTIEQLGHTQPDTRNTLLVTMMERLGKAENRYSGIPTIRRLLTQSRLPNPKFEDNYDEFRVTLFNKRESSAHSSISTANTNDGEAKLLAFCCTPRSPRRNSGLSRNSLRTVCYAPLHTPPNRIRICSDDTAGKPAQPLATLRYRGDARKAPDIDEGEAKNWEQAATFRACSAAGNRV